MPLLADIRVTERQADAQLNQLVPVLPFVSLPGSKSAYDLGTPVLARAGFIYIFYRDKLWRELEVRLSEGRTTYHDVDIALYREGTAFKAGERTPTGVPLEDIWLPSSLNDRPVRSLELCFSEIQLSATRLERLEQDAELRSRRCKRMWPYAYSAESFHRLYAETADGAAMLEAYSNFNASNVANGFAVTRANVARRNLEPGYFPVSLVAPQRAREPGIEWLLEHPARYLCDLTGASLADAGEQAKAFVQACARGTSSDNRPVLHTELLELSAVADVFAADTDLWQALGACTDVLARARQRKLRGVLLEDPRYRLRHLKARLETQHQLLRLCAAHAARQPNHASGLLVQQLIVPPQLNGKANPLHANLEKLEMQGRQGINRCTAVLERSMVWHHMNGTQSLLADALQLAITQEAIADHLSLDGFDYVSALLVLTQTVAALAAPPSRLDPLAPSASLVDAVSGFSFYTPKTTPGQEWLSALASDTKAPLHRMLWPECDLERVCKPYQLPAQANQNRGDGHFRGTELAAFEDTAIPPTPNHATLDASLVTSLLAGGSLDSFLIVSSKSVSGALLSIYDTLQSAVNLANAATQAAEQAHLQAETALRARQDARAAAHDKVKQTRAQLGARVRPVGIELHAQGIEQLRAMMPYTFSAAYFIPRYKVTEAHYLFGLEDLPSRPSSSESAYGQFLNSQGQPFRANRPDGLTEPQLSPGRHLVLVIPSAHRTAQLVSRMNRELTAAREADAQYSAAQDKSTQARAALARTLEQNNHVNQGATFRLLHSVPFSTAVLMIEIWNVTAEIQNRATVTSEKGVSRTAAGIFGAGIDFAMAMEALTVKVIGPQAENGITRKTLYEIDRRSAQKVLGETLAARFNGKVSALLVTRSVAAGIFTGLSLYDAWYAYQWNDSAMYGYLLIAAGGLSTMASGFFTLTPILGLSPLGWAALLLVGIGAGLVLWLSHSQLEDWLEKGPFGADESAKHLQDPQEAFYRLVGLLAGITINVEPNPMFEPDAKCGYGAELPFAVRSSNTVIRIESRLPGLVSNLGSVDIQADFRLREVAITKVGEGPSTLHKTLHDRPVAYNAQRLFPNALEIYLETPRPVVYAPSISKYFEWAVRTQFVLNTPDRTLYFPAPPVKDPTQFGPEYAHADFSKTEQPFWADEETHKGGAVDA